MLLCDSTFLISVLYLSTSYMLKCVNSFFDKILCMPLWQVLYKPNDSTVTSFLIVYVMFSFFLHPAQTAITTSTDNWTFLQRDIQSLTSGAIPSLYRSTNKFWAQNRPLNKFRLQSRPLNLYRPQTRNLNSDPRPDCCINSDPRPEPKINSNPTPNP